MTLDHIDLARAELVRAALELMTAFDREEVSDADFDVVIASIFRFADLQGTSLAAIKRATFLRSLIVMLETYRK